MLFCFAFLLFPRPYRQPTKNKSRHKCNCARSTLDTRFPVHSGLRPGSARSSPGMYAIFSHDRLDTGQRWRTSRNRTFPPDLQAIKRQQAGAGMSAPVPPAKYEKTNYRSFISSTKMKASKPLFSGILYSGDKVTLTYLAFTGENLSAWVLMPLPYWSSVISG